jgi:hypothetical protein
LCYFLQQAEFVKKSRGHGNKQRGQGSVGQIHDELTQGADLVGLFERFGMALDGVELDKQAAMIQG